MIKRLMCICYFGLVLSMFAIPARANDEIEVFLNDVQLEFDAPPVIIDGTTFVPMRAIFGAIGATLEWDGDTKWVTVEKDDRKIALQIGNPLAKVNEIDIPINAPARLLDGKTFVPLRFVSESLDCEVAWDGDTRTVKIKIPNDMEKVTGKKTDPDTEHEVYLEVNIDAAFELEYDGITHPINLTWRESRMRELDIEYFNEEEIARIYLPDKEKIYTINTELETGYAFTMVNPEFKTTVELYMQYETIPGNRAASLSFFPTGEINASSNEIEMRCVVTFISTAHQDETAVFIKDDEEFYPIPLLGVMFGNTTFCKIYPHEYGFINDVDVGWIRFFNDWYPYIFTDVESEEMINIEGTRVPLWLVHDGDYWLSPRIDFYNDGTLDTLVGEKCQINE